MTKRHTGNLFFSALFLLSALLAAIQPAPASAQEPAIPADPRPVDPKVRFGLEQGYEPDATPFSPDALTDAAGDIYDGAYDPAETYVSGQWGLPSAGGLLAADGGADIREWWAGVNGRVGAGNTGMVTSGGDSGRFYLESVQPPRLQTVTLPPATALDGTPHVLQPESPAAAPLLPRDPLTCHDDVGEGATDEVQDRMQLYWLPEYGCPILSAQILATIHNVAFYGQLLEHGGMVDNPNLPQAFFLPTEVFPLYETDAPTLGGARGSQPSAPQHYIDETHNFREQEIWYFEYGFIAINQDYGFYAPHRYFPEFPMVEISWEQEPVSTDNPRYKLVVDGAVDSSPSAEGVDTIPSSLPSVTLTVIATDLGGNEVDTFSNEPYTQGNFHLTGNNYFFITETLQVHVEASRSADLTGYAPCNYYDRDVNATISYLVQPGSPPIQFEYNCIGNGVADTTPPEITIVQVYGSDITGGNASVSVLVHITDDTGVVNPTIIISEGTPAEQALTLYPASLFGPDTYAAVFSDVPEDTPITITASASDPGGYSDSDTVTGYFSNGQAFGFNSCMDPCLLGYTDHNGNPVSTATGYKTEQFFLLAVPGPGEADIVIAPVYNSNSVRLGLFGAAMSSDLEIHLVLLYNPLVPGVEVVIGDGGRFRFHDNGDGTFTAVSQGNEDTLVKEGDSYLYTTRTQISYRFDADGRLLEKLDRNGNAVSYSYSGDQLTSVSTGGRTVTIAYNGDGYVSSLQIGGKTVNLTYDGDKLVGIEDANGGDWVLEYETRPIGEIVDERGEEFAYEANNHYLTRVITPEGRVKNEQTYDDQGRVIDQMSSAEGELTFSYVDNSDGSHETHITDLYGEEEIHYYNSLGQLVQKTNRAEDNEFYEYNDNFQMIFKEDFNGNEWHYQRDDNGNIIVLDGPEGLHQEWEYNDFNEPTYFKDGDGFEWRWEYDANGNVTRIIQPDGSDSEITYDSRGLPTDIYDFVGNHTVMSYDPLTGDLLSMTDGEGSTTTFTFDQYGRRATMTLPLGNTWSHSYDLNDNLTAVNGPLSYHTTFTYDGDDLLTDEVDADNRATTYEYDERGRLIETRNGENEPTFFEYGSMNELKEVTDARNAVTSYEHDALYRVIQVDMPEDVTHTFEYDGLGNVLFSTDGEDRVTATTYDGLSRPRAVVQNYIEGGPINADTNVVTQFEYNQRSLVTRLINPLGDDQELEYDNLGRLIRQENEEDEATLFNYDANGNILRITRPELDYIETTYNGRNQPETVRDRAGFITTFGYDLNGNLADVIAPDGIVTHYNYNPLDQRSLQTENYQSGLGTDHDLNVIAGYEYSLAGDLLKVVDGEGYHFTFEYDGAHRLIHEVNPEGEIHYTYDDVGNLIAQLDPNSHSWLYEYDLLGRLTQSTNPEGHHFRYEYDRANNAASITDARGYETTTTYDAVNRPSIITNALDYETHFTYDALGNLLALTDGNGHTTSYEYDKVQRLLARIDAEGFRTEWEYDDNGRQILRRIPFADPTKTIVDSFTYDGRDLLTSTTNGEGEVTSYAYNNVGLLETKTENDNIQTFYGYDALRRLNLVTLNHVSGSPAVDDLNVSYLYRYDRVGNLVSVLDPLSHETTFAYNGLGSLVFERNPIGSEWHYDYDPAQNLTFRQDANGQQTHYSYYPDNQLHVIDYPDNASITYQYDANNNPTRMSDGLGMTIWTYDPLNRITQVRDSLRRTVQYSYDALNRLSERYPDGRTVRYSYLDNDWLASATDPTNGVNRYNRDEAGRVVLVDHPNRTYSTRNYDRASRLLTIGNYQVGGDVLSSFSFSYDAVGQRTQAVNIYGWRNPPTVVEDYSYDGLRRLTGVSDSEGMVATYGYDRAGNRTEWQTNDNPFGQSPQDGFTATYEYDAANRLTTAIIDRTPSAQSETVNYSYDANGNRIDRLIDGNGSDKGTAYTYDDENRLVSAYNYLQTGGGNVNWQDETTMAYDGNGRRLVETYDPHAGSSGGLKRMEYTFDGLDPIAEYDLWNGQRRNYYRGDGNELLEMHNFPAGTQGQRYWYHHNGQGAIAGMTKQRGQSTHNYRYDAYGGNIPANGNFTNPHNDYTLTEKSWDDHSGLYYFGARHYDPLAAVWLTQDVYRGSSNDPLSLHRYSYVVANPINLIDEYGFSYTELQCIDDGINACVSPQEQSGSGSSNSVDCSVMSHPDCISNPSDSYDYSVFLCEMPENESVRQRLMRYLDYFSLSEDLINNSAGKSLFVKVFGKDLPNLYYFLNPARSPLEYRLLDINKAAHYSSVTNKVTKVSSFLSKFAIGLDIITTPLRYDEYKDADQAYNEALMQSGEDSFHARSTKWERDFKQLSVIPIVGTGIAVVKAFFQPQPAGGDLCDDYHIYYSVGSEDYESIKQQCGD